MNTEQNGRPYEQRDLLTTTHVLAEVHNERVMQENKWGPQNHAIEKWLMILGEEVGEANKEALEFVFAKDYPQHGSDPSREKLLEYRKELIQVAAVAVAMIESLDRNELQRMRI